MEGKNGTIECVHHQVWCLLTKENRRFRFFLLLLSAGVHEAWQVSVSHFPSDPQDNVLYGVRFSLVSWGMQAQTISDLVRPKFYKCNGGEYGSCLPVTLTHPDHTQLLPHTGQDLPVHVWEIPKKWLHFYQTSEELRLEKTTKQSKRKQTLSDSLHPAIPVVCSSSYSSIQRLSNFSSQSPTTAPK